MIHLRRVDSAVPVVALLVLASLLACKKKEKKEEPAAAPAPSVAPAPEPKKPDVTDKLFKVGETADAENYKLTLISVAECKPKGYTTRPKKGNIYLGAEVLVESKADRTLFVSPVHGKVVDADGITINHKFVYKSSCEPKLAASTRLEKGEKAKGFLTFEVGKDAKGLKLSYTPGLYKAQTVKFDLGR
jgi:hypothetical protein